ncbi:MAG: SDR family oxidoreductase [Acidimicrobiia bacterium]
MRILITGASSGIGEALAQKAASRKYDLVLVARRKDNLDQLAADLIEKYNVEVETIQADLTKCDDVAKIISRLEQDENAVSMLINNAGFGSSGPFIELDISNELNEIDLNVKTLVELTHCAANQMVKRGYGTIVNIASIAGYTPMAGNAVYGATKAFVISFSHALREELSSSGVNVMAVCPGLTVSEFHERSRWFGAKKQKKYPSFLWQSSSQVANKIFKGIDKQKGIVIPGAINKLFAGVSSSLPGSVSRKISASVAKGRRLR